MAKKKITCLGCGKGLKKAWAACPRCAKPNLARERVRKSAAGPAFLGKAAKVTVRKWAGMVACASGHPNRPTATCCTSCGQLMPGRPVPPLGAVNKSALADNFWARELEHSSDPAKREMYRQARWGQEGGAR